MSRAAQNILFPKSADCLERGDVIVVWGELAVVSVPSDGTEGTTIPRDQTISLPRALGGNVRGQDLCEPRVVFLGKTGRMSSRATYFLAKKSAKFMIRGFLDTEVRSAVPEPHPDAPEEE